MPPKRGRAAAAASSSTTAPSTRKRGRNTSPPPPTTTSTRTSDRRAAPEQNNVHVEVTPRKSRKSMDTAQALAQTKGAAGSGGVLGDDDGIMERPRKRGRPSKTATDAEAEVEIEETQPSQAAKKSGRGRKAATKAPVQEDIDMENAEATTEHPKRRPGRPARAHALETEVVPAKKGKGKGKAAAEESEEAEPAKRPGRPRKDAPSKEEQAPEEPARAPKSGRQARNTVTAAKPTENEDAAPSTRTSSRRTASKVEPTQPSEKPERKGRPAVAKADDTIEPEAEFSGATAKKTRGRGKVATVVDEEPEPQAESSGATAKSTRGRRKMVPAVEEEVGLPKRSGRGSRAAAAQKAETTTSETNTTRTRGKGKVTVAHAPAEEPQQSSGRGRGKGKGKAQASTEELDAEVEEDATTESPAIAKKPRGRPTKTKSNDATAPTLASKTTASDKRSTRNAVTSESSTTAAPKTGRKRGRATDDEVEDEEEPPKKRGPGRPKRSDAAGSSNTAKKSTTSRSTKAKASSSRAEASGSSSRGTAAQRATKAIKDRAAPTSTRAKKPAATKSAESDDVVAEDAKYYTADGHRYWLMKAEPESRIVKGIDVKFSIDDIASATKPEAWDGVRNHQAKKYMQSMTKGDFAFFYHSNIKEPGIVGVVEIVEEAQPDESAFDEAHPYYDPKSDRSKPTWFCVRVQHKKTYPIKVSLRDLQDHLDGALADMQVLGKNRLSISRVTPNEWEFVESLVGKLLAEQDEPMDDEVLEDEILEMEDTNMIDLEAEEKAAAELLEAAEAADYGIDDEEEGDALIATSGEYEAAVAAQDVIEAAANAAADTATNGEAQIQKETTQEIANSGTGEQIIKVTETITKTTTDTPAADILPSETVPTIETTDAFGHTSVVPTSETAMADLPSSPNVGPVRSTSTRPHSRPVSRVGSRAPSAGPTGIQKRRSSGRRSVSRAPSTPPRETIPPARPRTPAQKLAELGNSVLGAVSGGFLGRRAGSMSPSKRGRSSSPLKRAASAGPAETPVNDELPSRLDDVLEEGDDAVGAGESTLDVPATSASALLLPHSFQLEGMNDQTMAFEGFGAGVDEDEDVEFK